MTGPESAPQSASPDARGGVLGSRAGSVRLRRGWGWGLVMALTGLLGCLATAGCAGIPTSGPVVVGRPVGDVPRAPLRISGAQPKAGAGPGDIVRGFLRAAADLADDRNIARMFLAGPRQDSWRPDASVVIYAGDSSLTSARSPADGVPSATATVPVTPDPPDEGSRVTVTVRVPVLARVNGNGEYLISAPGDVEIRRFGLVARSGQWRIDTLADGSILTKADFDTTYSDLPVYFPDPTGGWLVPDVRWFPVGGATATVLVKAVLSGPSPWLARAVTTGVPEGTQLTASSVPVREGVAMVDLTGAARKADPMHRQMLQAQLMNTLAVLPQISPARVERVAITVESKTFDIPRTSDGAVANGRPGEPSPRLLIDPVVDEAPLVVDRGRIMRLKGRQLTAVEGLDALSGPALSWPAIATDGTAYAGLVGGTQLVYAVAGGKATSLVAGLGPLTPPSFDPLGWVWTAATTGAGVRAGRPDRGLRAVPTVDWPAGMSVTSLRISRDGTRALVSGQNARGGLLFVCAVERDRGLAPVRLGPPRVVLPDLSSARSAAWLDQRRVVVLGRSGSGPQQSWRVEIGGDAEATPPIPGNVSALTAGNGEIYAALPDGVLQLSLTIWVKVTAARWPALPG